MLGRSCLSLLAISLFFLLPPSVSGQNARSNPTPDFGLPSGVLNSVVRPPPSDPIPPAKPPTVHPNPIAPISIGLQGLTRAAGIIFSGTVSKIAREPATHGQTVETVAITFHVEKALRGATPGQDLTITQWIGLWTNDQRYRVGQRVLLFLYPPSKLGLTSAVAGRIGRFGVDPLGRILLTPQHLPLTQADPILAGKSRVTWAEFTQAAMRPDLRIESGIGELAPNSKRLP